MESNNLLQSATQQLTGNSGVSENLLIPVRVVDIILDVQHPEASKHGGYDSVGTIFYAEVYLKEGEEYPSTLRTAKPIFQFLKQYPLKNEIVMLMSNPGTNIYDVSNNASTYYFPNIGIWNHPHHNALPDMRYYTNDQSFKDDYEMVDGGLVRTVEDGNTDIPLGEYFKEKLKIQPLLPFEGDSIIEGRFGNSIRFGATAKEARDKTAYSTVGDIGDPITIFRNGQHIEEDDRGWEHTIENINTDHSSMYLTSNQKMVTFEAASPHWNTWFAKHDDLELTQEEKSAFDNITIGSDPEKIIEPEVTYYEADEDREDEDYSVLATPEGMCSTCEDDELSVYDQLMAQDNFDPDDFNWVDHEHVFTEEMELVRTEVDHIASEDGNSGEGGDTVDYSNEPAATGDEASRVVEAMDVLIGLGASKHGAAAIAGNMLAESRMIVDRLETSWLNKNQSFKGGIGLVQWTGSRRLKFEKHFGICNTVEERKQLIGTNNSKVDSYRGKVRQKVTIKTAAKYYWDEIGSSLQSKMKSATTAEAAADAILADLRPGAYLCWRDWDKGNRKYCNKGQTTKIAATAGKNKTRNKRVKKSMIAYNTYG